MRIMVSIYHLHLSPDICLLIRSIIAATTWTATVLKASIDMTCLVDSRVRTTAMSDVDVGLVVLDDSAPVSFSHEFRKVSQRVMVDDDGCESIAVEVLAFFQARWTCCCLTAQSGE